MAVASPSSDRAQTAQDFAVGISVFLLAVALVFAALPTIAVPAESADEAERERAERIADRLVAEFATHNELEGDRFVAALGVDGTQQWAFEDGVAVHLERLDGTPLEIANGEGRLAAERTPHNDRATASAARIVSLDSSVDLEAGEDDPAYRLVVEVSRA